MNEEKFLVRSRLSRVPPAVRLASIYLVFSVLWIFFSDVLAEKVADNNDQLLDYLQHIKGVIFVCLSSLLLYFTSRRLYFNIQTVSKRQNELLHKYMALNEATKEGVVDYDFENDEAVVNDQMKEMLGVESNVIRNFLKWHIARIHPQDRTRVVKNFDDFLGRNYKVWQSDYRYRVHDGSYRDIISRGYVIRDDKTGKPLHVINAIQDVTEIRNIRAIFYEQQINYKQSLAKSMIQAQETERNRWSEELHDNVCQLLTVAKLYLEQLSYEKTEHPAVLKSQGMVQKALNEIRQLSATIKPPEFTHTTLMEAVQELVANIARVRKFDFHLNISENGEERLNSDHKLMVYRVVQEQLNNIIKYADAKTVALDISLEEDQASVHIKDDGRGFDPSKIESGIGLRNIRSRLQVFSGNLQIESAPGKGCELIASFSLS